jgi:hypothetical protein
MTWHEKVEELLILGDNTNLEPVGKLYIASGGSARLIEALSGWLDTSVAEYAEMYADSLRRRITWLYPNKTSFTLGTNMQPTFAHVTEEWNENTPLPELFEPSNWIFAPHANGWQTNQDYSFETLLEILQALEEMYGKPKLILPWEDAVERVQYEDKEDIVYSDEESDPDGYADENGFYELSKFIAEDKLKYFSEWECEVCYGDEYVSEYSDYGRFDSFVSEIIDAKLVVPNLEEHCAACSHGVYDNAVKQDPQLEGKPVFLTWSQNSQGMVNPDGAISIDVWMEDEETAAKLEAIAKKHGLEYSYSGGEFMFGSSDW